MGGSPWQGVGGLLHRGVPTFGVGLLSKGVPPLGGLLGRGVSPWQEGLLPRGVSLRQTPPPMDRITDTSKNITLDTTSLQLVKIQRLDQGLNPDHLLA